MEETGVSPTLIEGCEDPLESSSKMAQQASLVGEEAAHRAADNQGIASLSLMTDELLERETGRVGLNVYLAWADAAGGYLVPFVIVFGYGAVEGIYVLSKVRTVSLLFTGSVEISCLGCICALSWQWWLTYWSQNAGPGGQGKFLAIYALINLAVALASFFRMIVLVIFGLRASRRVS
jgi:hypothetical protein